MRILVTGANGFIGKNLIAELRSRKHLEIFEYDKETNVSLLDGYCKDANFVFHLAWFDCSEDQGEIMDGNIRYTSYLLNALMKHRNTLVKTNTKWWIYQQDIHITLRILVRRIWSLSCRPMSPLILKSHIHTFWRVNK